MKPIKEISFKTRLKFQTHLEARQQIFDHIESFYNRQRAHSALGLSFAR
ncbi:MAG: hypothetical protein ACTHLW_03365 [Verrucomicrobiota bacterium]